MTTERTIFLGALDRDDPDDRSAYLDSACAGNTVLRRRVEALLRSHAEADAFLEVPALDQITSDDHALATLEPASRPNTLGRLDNYEILEVVGRGSTGLVLKARDTKLQRVVAIKLLAPRLAASPRARKRFVQEAQAAAAVRDDHVVAIYAVSDEGRAPYLVMEYIAGTTLQEKIKRQGPLALVEILRIGTQVAKGLAAAHAQGLIHRDIKPGNILLENGVERVKITDFGLARAAADDGNVPGHPIAGTPMFMSPEQARGEAIDCRSDLFSLGSLLYTLCTGRPPFLADSTVEELQAVCAAAPVPVGELRPEVPDWLGALVVRLHAPAARDRFASAGEVAELLGRRLAQLQLPPAATGPVSASVVEPAPPAAARAWRRKRLILAASLVGLLVLLGVILFFWKPWQDSSAGGASPAGAARAPVSLHLRRQEIPPRLLALAGGGDPDRAPSQLAAVLGDGRFLLPHLGRTAWMAVRPDGKVLAVPLDEDVVLFERATGDFLRTLKGPGGQVFYLTFSRDSKLLAATTRHETGGGALRVWELRSHRVLFTNPQPGPTISCAAAFSADGKRLFTDFAGAIAGWDAQSGRKTQTLPMPAGGIASMCFSPDGRRLAVANWTGNRVKFLEWTGDKLAETRDVLEHDSPVGMAVYSPDGRFLASGDFTGFKLTNAKTLEVVRTVLTPAMQLGFTPDSQALWSTQTIEQEKPVHIFTRWRVPTGKEMPLLSVQVSVEPVKAFHCLSPDGKVLYLAAQHDATSIKGIDTATGKELFPQQGHAAPLEVIAISPDGSLAASAGHDWMVKVWDLTTCKVHHNLKAHTAAVCGLSFSPDSKRLASGSRDGTMALWDVDSGTELWALHGNSRLFARIQFSPDGQTIAAGGESGQVEMWDAGTGKKGKPFPGHAGAVHTLAFHPRGDLLASAGADRTVVLHDLARGRWRKLSAPAGVNDVAFSPDGRTLAAVCDGPAFAVCLWDLETLKTTRRQGHAGNVRGLAFSPTAPLLTTCADDGTVRLWDLKSKRSPVRTIGPGPFGGPVRSVAFTPDGRYLATANANGTVYLLRVQGFQQANAPKGEMP
jgi:WD40 repeat protein/tRNA A-37 threonylcarbamoyl transferase component Bud32